MGNNLQNPFRTAQLGVDTQAAVDEYKARSVWGAWWKLDEKIRRRYFTKDEREFVTRYGARFDEIACHRTEPSNDAERHFLAVCVGTEEPRSDRERLWLRVQVICRYERSTARAARADLAEHDAAALRAENRALKAKTDHLELYAHGLAMERRRMTDGVVSICNVDCVSMLFRGPEVDGPPAMRAVISEARRGPPPATLTALGFR